MPAGNDYDAHVKEQQCEDSNQATGNAADHHSFRQVHRVSDCDDHEARIAARRPVKNVVNDRLLLCPQQIQLTTNDKRRQSLHSTAIHGHAAV